MKKIVILSTFALGLTLMSFSPKKQAAFEALPDGNFKIVNSNAIEQEDIDFLVSQTVDFKGVQKRTKVSFIKTTVATSQIKEVVTVDESNKTDSKPTPTIEKKVDQIIQKYMD